MKDILKVLLIGILLWVFEAVAALVIFCLFMTVFHIQVDANLLFVGSCILSGAVGIMLACFGIAGNMEG